MWHSEFAADPDVLGTMLDLDGELVEVIGVMPDHLEILTGDIPVFVPLGADPNMDRGDHYLTVVARLADFATFGTAQAELADIQRTLSEAFAVDQEWSATIYTSEETLIGDSTIRAGWILLTAAGLLLLMACVNVSNLLMVRATVRQGEMGLRAALGASRGRLVRQLFTESALLTAVGGAMGLMFARFALPFVKTMGEARIPRLDAASLDGTALAVCVISIAVASLVCGLAPVVQLRSRPLGRSIGSSHRGSSDPGSRLRSLLVGAQVSMTVVLLAGAGLLMRSFVELSSVDPGFEAKGTLAVRLDMPGQAYSAPERSDLRPRLRDAVASLPGVVAVGATATDPFSGNNLSNFVARLDRLPDRAADFTPIHWRAVTPGFFEAMGVELKAGRTFVDSDGDEGLGQVVIGESLASMMWGGEDPIDQIMVWSEPEGGRMRVIGVVEDLRDVGLAEEAHATIYRPHRYIPWAVMTLVARVQGDPATVAAGIRARIQEVVPGMPVREIRSLEENLHMAVAQPRFNFQLLASFAAVGLLMAVLGIYGLTAFEVRRRFREIGIRLTLGANPDGIRTMIFRQRMRLTAVGAGAGLVIARVLTRWIESSLYGITANDPITWIGVLSVVAGASALAAYLPARKATQVHPRDVLSGD
jgi:predicted permease